MASRPRNPAPWWTIAFAAAAVLWCAARASAQLAPEHRYNGVGNALPVEVRIADAESEARIDLFDPTHDAPAASAPVAAGRVDLYTVFPVLRGSEAAPVVRFAQLVVGGAAVGPPVVLVPMVTPARAVLFNSQSRLPWFVDPDNGRSNFDVRQAELRFVTPESRPLSGYVAELERTVVLDTTAGEMEFRLRYDEAPRTCRWFGELVDGGFYDGVPFHRIVPALATGAAFIVQFGDPTGTGLGGPGAFIDLEPSGLKHDFGVMSMARGAEPDSNGSQVFICLSREGTRAFDGAYTSFAECVRGGAVLEAIARTKVVDGEAADPPRVLSAKLAPAPPHGMGPPPEKASGGARSR